IDTNQVHLAYDIRSDDLVVSQLVGNLLHHRDDPIEILAIGGPDIQQGVGELLRVVLDRVDHAKGQRMHVALQVAQEHGAHRHAFHDSRMTGDQDHIPHGNRILDEDEDASDDVLDQGLGTKADGQAHDARARQQGRDVHADFGKDDQSHHHHEHDPQRVLGERQERSQALTAPLCRSALNRRLDVGGEDLPEEQRDDDDEADQEERREQASALFAAQPAERFHTPDFEDQQRCDDTKHAVQDPAEGGKIAVGTYFQEGVALPQFVVQVEDPVDQQPDEVRRRPRHREDQDGQERAVQEELETALDIQRPDDEAADDIGHGKNVPDFGEANPKIAQGRGGASAHQQIPHRLALLQDEN